MVVCVVDMIWHWVWRDRMGVVSSWVKKITNQVKRILGGHKRTQEWNWCHWIIWVQEWE